MTMIFTQRKGLAPFTYTVKLDLWILAVLGIRDTKLGKHLREAVKNYLADFFR